ncbi:hypothetical protein OROGR_011747 [Orobanche gracilis]
MHHKIASPRTHLYEGRTNPQTHLSKFRSYITGCGATDVTRCWMFLLTLGNLAHQWYISLLSRSVDSFDILETAFTSYFAAKVARLEGPHRLMKISQGKNEKDETYIDRMDEAVLMGEPISDELALILSWGFIGHSPMFRHLNKNFPITYTMFRARAADFLARQKMLTLRRGKWATGEKKTFSAELNKVSVKVKKAIKKTPGDFRAFENIEVHLLHELSLTPSHILTTIKDRDWLPKPKPIRDNGHLDRNKFYVLATSFTQIDQRLLSDLLLHTQFRSFIVNADPSHIVPDGHSRSVHTEPSFEVELSLLSLEYVGEFSYYLAYADAIRTAKKGGLEVAPLLEAFKIYAFEHPLDPVFMLLILDLSIEHGVNLSWYLMQENLVHPEVDEETSQQEPVMGGKQASENEQTA